MTTFCFVHGAWHDAWSWKWLIAELDQFGHHAIAVELPCEDPEATFETYAEVVAASLSQAPDDLVLVGHSLAGLSVPLVASLRPVGRIVFLCALLAAPGRSLVEQLQDEPDMIRARYRDGLAEDERGRTRWVDFDIAREVMYADCSEEIARAAFDHLRPQGKNIPYSQRNELDALPNVPMTYVICEEDQLVNPAWARQAVPERLGIEPDFLPGGHSPFLSRPRDLARLLSEPTQTLPL
ncbi:MAG: alpha/beta hydrolase [Solirubrobacterales bacterium]|nr:alpha/beta hydrolase [Solirubrobacterales bacterium]